MAILRYIVPLLLVMLLSGCYEDFNPDIDTEPVLCLNSLITTGEPIEVEVTHTWMFNDEKAEKMHDVPDARVVILANERIVGSDYLPKDGDKIRIVAESPTYGKAVAEVTVPVVTPIGEVRCTPTATSVWKDENHDEFGVTFNLNIEMNVNDPAGTDNYYRFGFGCHDGQDDGTPDEDDWSAASPQRLHIGSFEYNREPIFKEHIGVFETVMGNDEDTEFFFFSDRQFRGKSYTLHLNFTGNTFEAESLSDDDALLECGVDLYLITVSHSYYNWAVYKWNVEEGVIGDLSDLGFAESKWGYSNVSTGAGVVAAQSKSRFTINLKEFLKNNIKQLIK